MTRKKKDHRPFWTIDAETDPFLKDRLPQPFIWGLYDGLQFYTFDDCDALVTFMREHDVIAYAHNGGKFDFQFLIDYIALAERMTVIAGRLVSAKIGKCELRDSWNLLPVPLKTFGNKLEIDYRKLEKGVRDIPHIRAEIIEYLRVDCVDLWERIEQFEQQHGRHLTLAGAAMKTWEAMAGEKAPESDREYFAHFNPYYYGGRVQCFKSGYIPGPLRVFDINSAYPFAMLSEHPYGLEYTATENPSGFEATSFVKVSCRSAGALPWRDEKGAMQFPQDQEVRTYHVTGHELQAGIDTGTVSEVTLLECIDHIERRSFREYIEYFYDARLTAKLTGNVAEDVFAKLLMNSLYGKFGANPDNYGNFMAVPWADAEDYEYQGYLLDGTIGKFALVKAALDPWQERFFNVATAASITGAVRAKLWRAICASEGVCYVDTDSLICARTDEALSSRLGDWKLEGEVSGAWIAGKKMYCLEGAFEKGATVKTATKGVRLTPAEIKAVANGGTVTYAPDAPTYRLRGAPVFMERRVSRTA